MVHSFFLSMGIVVLTNLLGLYSGRVLPAKAELCDCHIIQNDVKVLGSLDQLSSDQQ